MMPVRISTGQDDLEVDVLRLDVFTFLFYSIFSSIDHLSPRDLCKHAVLHRDLVVLVFLTVFQFNYQLLIRLDDSPVWMGAKYAYVLLGLIFISCICFVLIDGYRAVAVKETACQNSRKLLAILQFAPFRLRAPELTDIVSTMNDLCGVEAAFFETDGRTQNRFSMQFEADGSVISGTRHVCLGD
jgi:hypothetical protein